MRSGRQKPKMYFPNGISSSAENPSATEYDSQTGGKTIRVDDSAIPFAGSSLTREEISKETHSRISSDAEINAPSIIRVEILSSFASE